MSPSDLIHPKRALISVYDKTDIVEFALGLHEQEIEILSSGGTAKRLQEAGIPVIEVSDYTGAAEMFEGRVKTLHPKIHGGILGRRPARSGIRLLRGTDDSPEMEKFGIPPIDIVCVNLYPFAKTISNPEVTLEEALENIDIGGPTMIRAAAKNFMAVCVVTEPEQYNILLSALKENGGIPEDLREAFARTAFHYTAVYDGTIARYFRQLPADVGTEEEIQNRILPPLLPLAMTKVSNLRYGENPHQRAAYYRLSADTHDFITDAEIIQGKEISYNNLLDIDAVVKLVREFPGKTAAAIVKHQNPTGVAMGDTSEEAYRAARSVDELASFGNVSAISGTVDEACAIAINEAFVEVIVALDFTPEACEIFKKKKNVRLIKTDLVLPIDQTGKLEGKSLAHGMLIQQMDTSNWDDESFRVVTRRQPTPEEMEAMEVAWRVVKHCRSNSTVLAKPNGTVGTGPGFTARVDSFWMAIEKAGENAEGACAATDGFCFPDSVEMCHEKGVTAIMEPGGSRMDKDVIEKADELGMAVVFTGMRHFKH
jgi:phosphoribosylaminoimidazolecarboxamide formyltransferase/IMP cyclohydrolase